MDKFEMQIRRLRLVYWAAICMLVVAIFSLCLVPTARADWPIYGTAYGLPGYDGVTIVFNQPMQSNSPLYHGTGLATISYPVENAQVRGALGTPYRETGSVEHVDVIYYVFNDTWPDDYTVFFSFGGEEWEFDFSDDKAEAVRIHPELPVKLIAPEATADAQVYGGGE